jgi:hypothetical protein
MHDPLTMRIRHRRRDAARHLQRALGIQRAVF